MGVLRLYLALCVVAAHSEAVFPWQMHDGRAAVQLFFVISGFYMELILSGDKYRTALDFYRGRLIRIFAPYYLSLAIVLGVSVTFGLAFGDWLTLNQTVRDLSSDEPITPAVWFTQATNLTLFFQDWVMFAMETPDGSLGFTTDFWASEIPLWHYLWIPQAWSIGVELTFYLVAPLLVRKCSLRFLLLLTAFALITRQTVYVQFDLNHDPWTYRFLPFELAFFCLGIIACRLMNRRPRLFERCATAGKLMQSKLGTWSYFVSATSITFLLWLLCKVFEYVYPYAKLIVPGGDEYWYLISLAVWVLILPMLFSFTRHFRADRSVGELSYPVYLLHYTIALAVMSSEISVSLAAKYVGIVVAAITVVVSILLQLLVLNRLEDWRQALMRKAREASVVAKLARHQD